MTTMSDTFKVSGIYKKSLVILLIFISFPVICFADNHYLAELQQQAQQANLAEKKQWQRFLHYQPELISRNITSLIQNKDYFFHLQGNHEPQLELKATLSAFFIKTGEDENSAQCRFPARFQWLKKQLKINNNRLPLRNCKALNNWLNDLGVSDITLVFPIAYLNNPASMFGHSFLKLDTQQTNEGSELLAWTVNYAAVTEKERGVNFAIRGLFGGYQGKFTLAPYYRLLKEYGDIENRDLWEYKLNFKTEEVQRLLLHLWELLPAEFDYYFINKNCSYQLLSLLEAARPELELSSQFNFDAIPADTIRALIQQQDLLKETRYRPALVTTLNAKAKLVNETQKQQAKALALEKINISALKGLSHYQQAQILELAFDYLSYLNADKIKHQQKINGQLAYELLTARSLLKVTVPKTNVSTPTIRPDEGHAGNRARLAYGYDGQQPYIETGYRWAYHDFYDPAQGFIKGAAVEFLKSSLRYYPTQQRVYLESFDLININSKPEYDDFIQALSWQVSLGAKRLRFADDKRYLTGSATIGGGLSYYPTKNSLVSINALSSALFNPEFHQYTAIGVGAGLDIQYDPHPLWRLGLEAKVLHYFQGITQTTYDYRIKQRVSLSNNHALILDLKHSREFSKADFIAELAIQFYF